MGACEGVTAALTVCVAVARCEGVSDAEPVWDWVALVAWLVLCDCEGDWLDEGEDVPDGLQLREAV